MKNSKISVFRKANDTTPTGTVSIYDFVTKVTAQERKAIDYIRSIPVPTNKEEKEFLRAEKLRLLECVTISGIFSVRDEPGLISHSGFACIDLDLKDNRHVANWATLKEQLKNIENIAYCGLSVSGRGYFCVIPIDGRHKDVYETLIEAFRLLGLNVDKSTSNVCSCRYKSYDDAPYINENAIPFSSVLPKVTVRRAVPRNYDTDSDTERQIALIEQKEVDITEDYHEWVKLGFAFANQFGEDGRDYFHRVSRFNGGYKADECDKKFDECLRSDQQKQEGGITIRHFFGRCKEAGLLLKLADFD